MVSQVGAILVDAAVVWLLTLFTFTGVIKLATYRSSVATIARYDAVLGRTAAHGAGYALPWMELAVAAAIAVSSLRSAGGWAAACLGLAFALVAGLAVRTKVNLRCGCGGGATRGRVGMVTVARGILISAAGVAVATMSGRAAIEPPIVAGLVLAAACPGLLLKAQQLKRTQVRSQGVRMQPPLPITKVEQ